MKIFLLRNKKREKKYIKFLSYSLNDPINKAFRGMLIVVKEQLGYVYLLLMFFTSGISTVLSKYLLMGHLNAFHILTYTSFVGLVTLFIFYKKRGIEGFIKSNLGISWLVLAAVTGFSLYEITFNIALQYMSVSQTIIIYYSNPIFLYFASLIFLYKGKKRNINIKVLLGILLSFSGVYFVLTGGKLLTFSINAGIIYVFISIVSIIIFTILGKKKEIPELQFLFMGQAISLISGIIILGIKNWWVIPTIREIIYIIFIAVIYNIINMVFYIKTIQFLSVEKLSTLMYASPIITSGLAVIILKEPLFATTVVGLVLVIFGNIVASVKNA